MRDQSVIVRDPIPINLWQAISDIMSKHIQELSQAEASSASDSESDNGVSIPGEENSAFFSDEDESLISSTDGKKNISTISDHKGIETNLSLEFLQSELKKSRKEIEELREVTEKQRLQLSGGHGIGRDKHWTRNVGQWVKLELFPKVKFITGDIELDERGPTSLALSFRAHFPSLFMGTDKDFESIWQTYKNDINKVMSEKRNAVVTTLKHAFASK